MATANEILNVTLGEESVITVDFITRTINIPDTITFLGVESDDDILPLNFKMPRKYQGVDLSKFDININYLNAQGQGDVYDIADTKVDDDYITFTWMVGRFAAQYAGNVQFNICLKEMDEVDPTIIIRELNTTIAVLPVLKGLETDNIILQQYADVLLKWQHEIFGIGATLEQGLKDVSGVEQNTIKNLSTIEQNNIQDTIKNLSTIEQNNIKEVSKTEQNTINTKVDESIRTWLDENPSTILTDEEIETLTSSLV